MDTMRGTIQRERRVVPFWACMSVAMRKTPEKNFRNRSPTISFVRWCPDSVCRRPLGGGALPMELIDKEVAALHERAAGMFWGGSQAGTATPSPQLSPSRNRSPARKQYYQRQEIEEWGVNSPPGWWLEDPKTQAKKSRVRKLNLEAVSEQVCIAKEDVVRGTMPPPRGAPGRRPPDRCPSARLSMSLRRIMTAHPNRCGGACAGRGASPARQPAATRARLGGVSTCARPTRWR